VHHGEHNAVTTDTTGPCGCRVCRSFPATKRDKGGFAAEPSSDEKSSLKEAIPDGATVSIPSCPLWPVVLVVMNPCRWRPMRQLERRLL
ncbi:hypothetical protein, partial [Brevundimonas sp.]|uniref:hypothetical protein n=1 Tax=Brevundimonas sp. TaxID=1871086 RepID=UPI00261C1765